VLSCSGDDLAIPYNPNPLGNDVLAAVRGHLDVHSSAVAFEVRWHFGVPVVVPNVADFSLTGVHCSSELVDVVSCLDEALVGEGGVVLHRQDKAVYDGARGVVEVVVLHVKDGLS